MVLVKVAPHEVLRKGLELAGWDRSDQQKVSRATLLSCFKGWYGALRENRHIDFEQQAALDRAGLMIVVPTEGRTHSPEPTLETL